MATMVVPNKCSLCGKPFEKEQKAILVANVKLTSKGDYFYSYRMKKNPEIRRVLFIASKNTKRAMHESCFVGLIEARKVTENLFELE